MDKKFLTIVVVIVAAFGFLLMNNKKDSTSSTSSSKTPSSHSMGAGNKKVELIEYGDFQCPVCGAYYPVLEQVVNKYGDDIKFTFRNFPLDSIHQNARAAHRAVEAASIQGKFWEMYRALYENQQNWSEQSLPLTQFESYAREIGLDVEKFKTDYASEAVNNVINADVETGQALKITGTPGFVLNGKLIENPRRDVDSFVKIIDEAIAEANKDTAATTPAPTEAPASTTPTPESTPTP